MVYKWMIGDYGELHRGNGFRLTNGIWIQHEFVQNSAELSAYCKECARLCVQDSCVYVPPIVRSYSRVGC